MKVIRRKSRQRERIFELIKLSKDHPTAQWIYETLRSEIPSLSLGNVYRNIKILSDEGRIKCRDFGDGIEHFDAITEIHYHFICEKCKTVTDFSMPVQASITEQAQSMSHHSITGHSIQFYGICSDCSKTH